MGWYKAIECFVEPTSTWKIINLLPNMPNMINFERFGRLDYNANFKFKNYSFKVWNFQFYFCKDYVIKNLFWELRTRRPRSYFVNSWESTLCFCATCSGTTERSFGDLFCTCFVVHKGVQHCHGNMAWCGHGRWLEERHYLFFKQVGGVVTE